MPAIYLDQNTAGRLGHALALRGFTVFTPRETGLRYAPDAQVLRGDEQNGWTVVTKDRDFIGLHLAWLTWPAEWKVSPLPQHAGVLVIPSGVPIPIAVTSIEQVFHAYGSALANALYEERGGYWILVR